MNTLENRLENAGEKCLGQELEELNGHIMRINKFFKCGKKSVKNGKI